MSDRKKVALPNQYTQGIKCPECQCRDLRVYGTVREGARVKRYRRCRNCAYAPIITYEYVADDIAPSHKQRQRGGLHTEHGE